MVGLPHTENEPGATADWYQTRNQLQVRLADHPDDLVGWSNLAYAHLRCGDNEAAEQMAQRALSLDEQHVPAWINLGASLLQRQRLREADEAAQKAMWLGPEDASAHLFAGQVAREAGRISAAHSRLLVAVRLDPRHAECWAQLALINMELGLKVQALNAIESALVLAPNRPEFHSNRLMIAQYHPDLDSGTIRQMAQHFGRRMRWQPLPETSPARLDRPLHVAYLSPDFRAHPVGYILRDVITAHDPDRVKSSLWNLHTGNDWLSDEYRSATAAWHDVHGLSDDALAQALRQANVDVLVDLAGHTAHNRLGVIARQPARAHCSFLGWFGAIGVPGLDAILMGADHLDHGSISAFAEPVLPLDGTHFRYRRLPGVGPPDVDEPAGPVRFGCFNNIAKLHAEVIDGWAAILHRVPDALLELRWKTLADPPVREGLIKRFQAAGIRPERLSLHGACPHHVLLAAYRGIHIALDPFPFSGGMTSLEALSSGVPVVTLAQLRPVSRQTHALLKALDLDALSTGCVKDYVDTVVELACDTPRRRRLRRQLVEGYEHSVLADSASLARSLEAAYVELLARREGTCARPAR
jgi:protein O-GlcNAc transferase